MYNFLSFPELRTERLWLRYPTLDDKEALFNLRSHLELNAYITRDIPKNISEIEAFITMICKSIKDSKNIYWVITNENQHIIGTIGYHHFSADFKYAEIGYELHPDFHNKGYMTEALKQVISIGFNDMKLDTIEAFTHKHNERSKSLLKKHKFTYQPDRVDEGFENNIIFQLKQTNKQINA